MRGLLSNISSGSMPLIMIALSFLQWLVTWYWMFCLVSPEQSSCVPCCGQQQEQQRRCQLIMQWSWTPEVDIIILLQSRTIASQQLYIMLRVINIGRLSSCYVQNATVGRCVGAV